MGKLKDDEIKRWAKYKNLEVLRKLDTQIVLLMAERERLLKTLKMFREYDTEMFKG